MHSTRIHARTYIHDTYIHRGKRQHTLVFTHHVQGTRRMKCMTVHYTQIMVIDHMQKEAPLQQEVHIERCMLYLAHSMPPTMTTTSRPSFRFSMLTSTLAAWSGLYGSTEPASGVWKVTEVEPSARDKPTRIARTWKHAAMILTWLHGAMNFTGMHLFVRENEHKTAWCMLPCSRSVGKVSSTTGDGNCYFDIQKAGNLKIREPPTNLKACAYILWKETLWQLPQLDLRGIRNNKLNLWGLPAFQFSVVMAKNGMLISSEYATTEHWNRMALDTRNGDATSVTLTIEGSFLDLN